MTDSSTPSVNVFSTGLGPCMFFSVVLFSLRNENSFGVKMNPEVYALDLARRLTQAEAGHFRAQRDTVFLDGAAEGAAHLQVIDAGSGRTEQVVQALRRAQVSPLVPVIVGRRFSKNALAELNSADANYMDDRHLKVRLRAPDMLIRLQDQVAPPAACRCSGF